MEKHGPVHKKKTWNFAFMGYLTGRSAEERADAQVNRLTTHTHTHTLSHTQIHNIGPHFSALKGIIVYLALRSMGPSTDR